MTDPASFHSAHRASIRISRSPHQRFAAILVAIAVFLLVGQAISHLVSSSLGQTPADQAWNYVIALLVSLGIGGACAAVPHRSTTWNPILRLSGIATGAITGFYYSGLTAGKNPQMAVVGAIAGGLLVILLTWRWPSVIGTIALRLSGAIAAYGWFFWVGATALDCLNTQHWFLGLLLSGLSLLYLWFTARSLRLALSLF
jgi:uncharacterized membrane protein